MERLFLLLLPYAVRLMDLPGVKLATPNSKMAKSSHSGKSSTAGRTAAKKCAFECGKTNLDPDCENPDEPMRWAYKDGSGQNCWYCEKGVDDGIGTSI